MRQLNAERTRHGIVEHTRLLAESAAAAGAAASVPTTPGWSVTDLVRHVGQTQHWVAEIIERRITEPTELPTAFAELPAGPQAWPGWLTTSARRIADACSDDALDAPVFNPAGDGRSGTRFWLVSVLNETVVHGFDAADTAGVTFEVDPDVAALLIDNHLRMLTSPTWAMQRPESAHAIRGVGQTLQWAATDVADDGAWFIERMADGAAWQLATRQADVTVNGSARDLLLVLTRRLALDSPQAQVAVSGDRALVQHWLDSTAHVSG